MLLKITILYKWHLEQCAQCWSSNVSLNNYLICKSCHSWCNKDLVLCWSMEDVPEIHDYHDGNHDTGSHHQCTGFCPRFPEIPVIWSHKEHPCTCTSWQSWYWSWWWLEFGLLDWGAPADNFYVWIKSLPFLVAEIMKCGQYLFSEPKTSTISLPVAIAIPQASSPLWSVINVE